MVEGTDEVVATLGSFELDARVPVLLAVAGVLAFMRLGLHLIVAYLPSRMAADAQAADPARPLRRRTRDRRGRPRPTSTTATSRSCSPTRSGRPPRRCNQTGNLFSSGSTFLTLVLSAFLLGPLVALRRAGGRRVPAAGRCVRSGSAARRHSAALSASLLDYAGAVGRVGPAWPRRPTPSVWPTPTASRIRVHIDDARRHFVLQQFTGRLVQGVYQGLMILLLVAGLGDPVRVRHRPDRHRSARSSSSWSGPPPTASRCRCRGRSSSRPAPFLERLDGRRGAYRAQRRRLGRPALPARGRAAASSDVSFTYNRGAPVLTDITFTVAAGDGHRHRRSVRGGQVHPRPAAAAHARADLGRSSRSTGSPSRRSPSTTGTGGSPTCRRSPAWCRAPSPRTSGSPARSPTTQVERAARLAHIHDYIVGDPARLRDSDRPAGRRRVGWPAAAHLPGAGPRRRTLRARARRAHQRTRCRASERRSAPRSSSSTGRLTMFIVTHQPNAARRVRPGPHARGRPGQPRAQGARAERHRHRARAGDRLMADSPNVRVYGRMRTIYLELFREMVPARVLYWQLRPTTTRPRSIPANATRPAQPPRHPARAAPPPPRRGRDQRAGHGRPLGVPRRSWSLAVRLRSIVARRRSTIAAYCMANADPALEVQARWHLPPVSRRGLTKLMMTILVRSCDRLAFATGPSMELYEQLRRRARPCRSRSRLYVAIPSAVPLPRRRATEPRDPTQVLFVGGFVERKGIRPMMAAWEALLARRPDARLRHHRHGPPRGRGQGVGRGAAVRDRAGRSTPSRHPPSDAHERLAASSSRSGPGSGRSRSGSRSRRRSGHGCEIVTTSETGIADWLTEHGHPVLDLDASPEVVADAIERTIERAERAARGPRGPPPRRPADRRRPMDDDGQRTAGRRPPSQQRRGRPVGIEIEGVERSRPRASALGVPSSAGPVRAIAGTGAGDPARSRLLRATT